VVEVEMLVDQVDQVQLQEDQVEEDLAKVEQELLIQVVVVEQEELLELEDQEVQES
jgi:hypothetical protein